VGASVGRLAERVNRHIGSLMVAATTRSASVRTDVKDVLTRAVHAPITRHHLRLLDAAEAIRLDPDKTETAFMGYVRDTCNKSQQQSNILTTAYIIKT
jgi:hypothetical protein